MLKKAELLAMDMAEYNVLVRMDPVEETTRGGIILTGSQIDRVSIANDMGTLVKVGQLAFGYAAGWSPPREGDRVLIAQYDGKLYEVEGEQYRVVKDKSVVGFWRVAPALAEAA